MIFALSARTQAGGHYAGPVYTHTVTATDSQGSHDLVPDEGGPNDESGYGSFSANNTGIGYNGNTGVSITFHVTATFTWTPDAETPDAPPPDKAYFRETGSAGAGDFFFYGNGSPTPPGADNGLGDTANLDTDDEAPSLIGFDSYSHGSHLKEKDGATVTFTHTLSASLSGDYAAGSGGVFYSVGQDTRALKINYIQTYYKDPDTGQRTPNGAKDDFLLADSVHVRSGQDAYMTFSASAQGFSQGSFFNWTNQTGTPTPDFGSSTSGTFGWLIDTPPTAYISIQNFPVKYAGYDNSGRSADGGSIKVTDAQDSTQAEADYLVIFHDPIEGWTSDDGYPKHHPVLENPTRYDYGEWTMAGTEENPSDQAQPAQNKGVVHAGEEYDNSGSIGGSLTATFGPDVIKDAFQLNENFSIEDKYTFSSDQDFGWTLPANSRCWKFWAIGWTEIKGKNDVYQSDGFLGSYPHYGIRVDSVPGQPGISTTVYSEPLQPQ